MAVLIWFGSVVLVKNPSSSDVAKLTGIEATMAIIE
jgi:hypothetical protein